MLQQLGTTYINVSKETIDEFISIFDINTITTGTWKSISRRLSNEIDTTNSPENQITKRYLNKSINKLKIKKEHKITKSIPYSNNDTNGIFYFFRTQSNIDDEIEVKCSSIGNGNPKLLLDMNNTQMFYTRDETNPWICFEFKNHRIILSNYSIKSKNCSPNSHHPKNWIIEGSKDEREWSQIDEQNNCSYLNGSLLVHTFTIQNTKLNNETESTDQEFKFIRIRHTGNNWAGTKSLELCSIELYGDII